MASEAIAYPTRIENPTHGLNAVDPCDATEVIALLIVKGMNFRMG